MDTWLKVIGGVMTTGLVFLLGVLVPFKISKKASAHRYLAFSAGFLLAVVFIKIIPKGAMIDAKGLGIGMIISYILVTAMEHFVLVHSKAKETISAASMCIRDGLSSEEQECHIPYHHALTSLPSILAFSLHNFADGLGLAVGFLKSVGLGLFTFLAILFHKFPAGISLGAIFLKDNKKVRQAILYSLLIVTFSLLGAITALYLGETMGRFIRGLLLGFAGGSFIYLGATHMLPEAHKEEDRWCFLLFLIGILSFWALNYLIS